MTRAPSRAKTRVMPSPIPLVEPVTRMTLSFSRMGSDRWCTETKQKPRHPERSEGSLFYHSPAGGQRRARAQFHEHASWSQHALDDFARMHFLERFAPLRKRRNTIKDQIELQFAACQQRNHLFPDRPVVREAALQRHRLLHERVERKIQRLRSPADFRDVSRRPDDIECQFQRRGNDGGIDDKIDSMAVPEISYPFLNVFAVCAESCFRADFFGYVETLRIGGNPDHDQMARARKFGHERAEQTNRSRPDHGNRITWANMRVDANCVIRNAARFRERSHLKREACRDCMQTARGHTNTRRHRAVDAIAKSEPLWIEIVQALPNESRVGGQHGGGFADDAVAFLKAAHAVARFRDDAGEFMPENDRKVYWPALRTRVLVEIAAANADGLHGEEDIFFAKFRLGHFAEFDGMRILCVMN